MLPGHCKDISYKEVGFFLTSENINRAIVGKKAYTRCDYYILRNGDEFAIVRVSKQNGMELFRPIIDHEIIALPRDIDFVEDSTVDVLNHSHMARLALRHPKKFVVVQGMFGHISFVHDEDVVELMVLDVVPPYPSKLSVLVERALSSGMVELPIVPIFEEIDLNRLGEQASTEGVIFPCKASGMSSDRNLYFLDQLPVIESESTLVGCDLSERIYHANYVGKIERINMCPRDLAPNDGRKRIVKCCQVREGYQLERDLVTVPWGATVQEVASAIHALLSDG